MERLSFFENDPGSEKAQRIGCLISAYLRNTLNSDEHTELEDWVAENDGNMRMFEDMTDADQIQEGVNWVKAIDTTIMLKKLKKQLRFKRARFRIIFFQYAV